MNASYNAWMPVDLTLLRTFTLLYETGSVTETANNLNVTQPAVSHALARLRKQLNDTLFLRTADGLSPTDTARRLYPEVRQGLEVIDAAVADTTTFDPSSSTRTFRLIATDLGQVAFLPTILTELQNRGPKLGLEVVPFDLSTAADLLRRGQVDAVICTPRLPDPDLHRDALFHEHYVGICATTHPAIGDEPTLDQYLAERHLSVNAAAGHQQVEEALRAVGDHHPNVAVRVSHFAAIPRLLEDTRYLAIVPSTVAPWCARAADVRKFTLPFTMATIEIGLYTFRRRLPAPAIEWLRQLIINVLRTYGRRPARDRAKLHRETSERSQNHENLS